MIFLNNGAFGIKISITTNLSTSQIMTFVAIGYSIRPTASGQIKWRRQPTYALLSTINILNIQNLKRFPTFSDLFRPFPTFSDLFRHFPTFSDVFRRFPTFSDVYRHLKDVGLGQNMSV